jgi:TolB-like protein/DNA-binding winged helix-turn-helix (wHTH) protein/cytochrome c-type biogenesis protein CcmH/NrfG
MTEPSAVPKTLRFGSFEADLRSGELRKQGTRIRLQEQPFQILSMLLERPGEVVTREELRQSLWPEDTFVDFDHSLNTAVNKLREALNDSADAPRFVETLPRRGYRFIAAVEEIPKEAAKSPPVSPEIVVSRKDAPGVVVDVQEMKPKLRSEKRRWVITISVMTTAVLALLGTGYHELSKKGDDVVPVGAGNSPRIESLAVLPLENLTGDPAQDYFADGMTDALITNLARIRSLRVISRTSVMQYKNARAPLPEIARKLNVDGIIEGSVQRSGNRVRITVQFLHGPTDQHIWAREYDSELTDILALQGDLSRAIAQEIHVNLSTEEQARWRAPRPVNLEAYEAYLRARASASQWNWDKAIDLFQQAIRLDPGYAAAHAALAECYVDMHLFENISPGEVIPRAKQAASRALKLDESLVEAHLALGAVFMSEWNWSAAQSELKRAIELNPGHVKAHAYYAVYHRATGDIRAYMQAVRRVRDLDPLSQWSYLQLAEALVNTGQYDQAITELQLILQLFSERKTGLAHRDLGLAYLKKGMNREGIAETLKYVETLWVPNPDRSPELAYAFAVAGEKERALEIVSNLRKLPNVSPVDVAAVFSALGDAEQAFQWLDKAYETHNALLIFVKLDPRFDRYRSDPRFRDLVRRVGLPVETPKASP